MKLRKFTQSGLIGVYGLCKKLPFFSHPLLQRLLISFYFLYKRYLEDPFYLLTKQYPQFFQNGNILDVGANVGYTSKVFVDSISPRFKVFAFEPEDDNFQKLKTFFLRSHLLDLVEPIKAAVGNQDGVIKIWKNHFHHGDHRVLTNMLAISKDPSESFSVPILQLDSFAIKKGLLSQIAFVKIDVQGYELPVIQGMSQIISLNPHLVIVLEISPLQSQELGLDAQEALKLLSEQGFSFYSLKRSSFMKSVETLDVMKLALIEGYIDILCKKN